MLLLVGLGNPGVGYAKNRHNIGFMAVDTIVRRHSFQSYSTKFLGEFSAGHIGRKKVLVLKPSTFMNESGRSVAAASKFYEILPECIFVIHDELDLAFSKFRLKFGGGNAGHNGLRSIDAHVGDGYWRFRLGIGHPGKKSKVSSHVLSDFFESEQKRLTNILSSISDHIELALIGESASFLYRVNSDLKQ